MYWPTTLMVTAVRIWPSLPTPRSHTQVFYQHAPRHFEPGPQVKAVGFHPNALLRLPGQNRPLYLMNAEGLNQLLAMAPTPSGGLAVVSSRPVAQPKSTTPFRWPGWGLCLAVAPFSRSAVTLLKGFDPLTGWAEGMVIPCRIPMCRSAISRPPISMAMGSTNWYSLRI